ncbi:hypothetical protein TRSC58_05109 [Trypanosoma rangeli SC58]|uniref:Uncharacterized protein n=1 Tax=Trypanosoma rangeli SC58 TaxID=429131 RepID=A0A061J1Q5_TRYRA|nr:hypothetical protein TRSC58_05109 [Trypanosoma rangeli SC58]
MKHFRGWLAVCLVSVALFMLVDIPVAQQRNLRGRTIFVATMTSLVWLVYLMLLYVFLHRLLRRSTEVYRKRFVCCCSAIDGGVFLWFKEQHNLNATLASLRGETESMEQLLLYWWPSTHVGRNSLTRSMFMGAATTPVTGSPESVLANGAL